MLSNSRGYIEAKFVPPVGFEPTICALRRHRPRPLDDGGIWGDFSPQLP
jgi:hypothetical protein